MIHIPTRPYTTLGFAMVPHHGKRLLCIASDAASLAAMHETLRAGRGDYRMSWHDDTQRHTTLHEVRVRGVTHTADRNHAYRPVSERLHEVEAKADAFEPMQERLAA